MGKKNKKANKAAKSISLVPFSGAPEVMQAQSSYQYGEHTGYSRTFAVSYDGEKNHGEMGPIKRYMLDYDGLRDRSWQAYLDSEIAQIVINRNCTWMVGTGLKLQCEPQKVVLESEGVDFNAEEFNKQAEARFKIFSESNMSSYSGMGTMHTNAEDAFRNSIIGGDVLVVLRVINNQVKVELIDGAHVCTPNHLGFNRSNYVAANGNRVINGIEIDVKGEHVAYHIRKSTLEFERIPARGAKSGHLMAYMVYGLRYRLNNIRGIPLIVAVMETVKKLERYKEATVGSAEERQKIPYFIEHGITSTGENPLIKNMARAFNADRPGDNPQDVNGVKLADTVAATTNKMVFNLPQDSKMVQLDSKNELSFGEFYMNNFDIVCATVEIPPNVALSKYDSNFSASRAALKDWEHTMIVKRRKFADQFYKPIYKLWLDIEIHTNKVHAPGYIEASMKGNQMAVEAYTTARFTGANVPHIDPLKEVNAERAKLGTLGASIPLTTVEAATEALNGGESASNMQQFAEELKTAKELGIEEEKEEAVNDPKTEEEDD